QKPRGAGIGGGAIVGGRRREVQHGERSEPQPREGRAVVQISAYGYDAGTPQIRRAVGLARKPEEPVAPAQKARSPQGDVAASDEQYSASVLFHMSQVIIKPSDHSFACEDGQTILQGALHGSLIIPYGCRNGACGTCKGKVLSGEVDHGH